MLSKFLKKYNKKKQIRNRFENIHENCYLDAKYMKENSIKHVSQSKKMKKSDCFIQEDDSNFLIIPESRNCKYGIKYMKIDQRKSCKEESLNYIHNVLDKKSKRVTMGNSSPLLGEILKEELKNRKVIILDLKNK